jgi:FMN phosphatase YigB (HAD superfamily)
VIRAVTLDGWGTVLLDGPGSDERYRAQRLRGFTTILAAAGAGLLAQFSALTFSDECGIRKPDPQIFLETLREIGVSPDEAVHVGDDPVLDVEGARDARMAGVIQITADRRANGCVAPDAVIAGLEELPAALDQLHP